MKSADHLSSDTLISTLTHAQGGKCHERTNPTITEAVQCEIGRDSVERGPETVDQPIDRSVPVVSHVQQPRGAVIRVGDKGSDSII
ncbi:MAG: hypothetical protein ACJA07_004588 [Rhodococcus sp. (in: high G+C Gram-positive bacteria)]|jgi:hypothetical protein